MKRRTLVLAIAATAALGAAVAFMPDAQSATAQLRFTFDAPPSGQATRSAWTGGCFVNSASPGEAGCVAVGGTGSLSRTDRAAGGGTSPAVQFPDTPGATAVIRVPNADHLNPGTSDFTITAIVRLAADEVSAGANLVQKGYTATTGGQWKLQVDSGRPSCKIIGSNAAGQRVSAIVWWPESIAGEGWQFLTCKRRGGLLSIGVGDAPAVTSPDNAAMNITNTADVTIGAKGTGTNNDQFHGAIDNPTFIVN